MESAHKTKFEACMDLLKEETIQKWEKIQEELRAKMVLTDDHKWNQVSEIKYIGGMDISASKKDPTKAISAYVIVDSTLSIVYMQFNFVTMEEPYVPGFLAFREVDHLVKLVEEQKSSRPEITPDVVLIDGNGIFHTRKFGVACHLGVLCDLTTIGCGKTIFSVDGINKEKVIKMTDKFSKAGDHCYLCGDSGETYGVALRATDDSKKPLIISVGNKISLENALRVVEITTRHRVPEPIRIADIVSRRVVTEYEKRNFMKFDINKWILENKVKLNL